MLALHDEQMAEHCGAGGVRDLWLHGSPLLARPRELDSPGESHAAALAAIHAFGVAWSPPVFAGNERTAIVLVERFLSLNCNAQNAYGVACVLATQGLAASEPDEVAFTASIGARVSRMPGYRAYQSRPMARVRVILPTIRERG